MTSNHIYHYVYRITNLVENKHYYGKRSSKIEPKLDLGKKYFSSSTDKEFRTDQKLNPQNYKYKIVQHFETTEHASIREIMLHAKFDVGVNKSFYNKSKATSSGFDRTGVPVSKETRAKMAASKSGTKLSEVHKSQIGIGNTGKIQSAEHNANISAGHMGISPSEETRDKIGKANTGRKRSAEAIAKTSAKNKGRKRSKDAITASANGISGIHNYAFLQYYVTPLFTTDAKKKLNEYGISKHWCMEPNKLISKFSYGASKFLKSNYTWDYIKGKTYSDLGFGHIPKSEYNQFVSA